MDPTIAVIPETGQEIGITTVGRRSGRPRRKEVRLYELGGRLYITGSPGRRDWYANLLDNPQFTVHRKGKIQEDLPAKATPIADPSRRRELLSIIHRRRGGWHGRLESMVERSPLVEVHLTGSSFQDPS